MERFSSAGRRKGFIEVELFTSPLTGEEEALLRGFDPSLVTLQSLVASDIHVKPVVTECLCDGETLQVNEYLAPVKFSTSYPLKQHRKQSGK